VGEDDAAGVVAAAGAAAAAAAGANDRQLVLLAGRWRAVLLPGRGASFAALTLDGRDLLEPLPTGGDPTVLSAGAFLMLPWCNRLDGGRMPLPGGGEHRFPLNRADEGNAIHGLSRDHPWGVAGHGEGRARLVQSLSDGPYRYDAALEVLLDGEGLQLRLSATSRAERPLFFGLGWHPFFRRPAGGARVSFRAGARLQTDARNLPLGGVADPGQDDGNPLGLDAHYAGWDGRAAAALDGLRLELRAEGPWAGNLQLYAPEAKPVLAIEPVSHAPDVVNRPALARYGAMTVLTPGETMAASLRLRAA